LNKAHGIALFSWRAIVHWESVSRGSAMPRLKAIPTSEFTFHTSQLHFIQQLRFLLADLTLESSPSSSALSGGCLPLRSPCWRSFSGISGCLLRASSMACGDEGEARAIISTIIDQTKGRLSFDWGSQCWKPFILQVLEKRYQWLPHEADFIYGCK